MLQESHAFSGLAIVDLQKSVNFYQGILGLEVEDMGMGLQVRLGGGSTLFLYVREHHQPAAYTVLNFPVDDIDAAVDKLVSKGIVFEHYDDLPETTRDGDVHQMGDLKGVWFKDPDGNILSVVNELME